MDYRYNTFGHTLILEQQEGSDNTRGHSHSFHADDSTMHVCDGNRMEFLRVASIAFTKSDDGSLVGLADSVVAVRGSSLVQDASLKPQSLRASMIGVEAPEIKTHV